MRDSELGIEARPMPGKEEMAQEDGSVMKKDELEVGKAKERPDTSDGMVGPVWTDESAIGNGPAWGHWRAPLVNCITDPGSTVDKKVQQQVLKHTLIDDDL
jgi:hypothetical protein